MAIHPQRIFHVRQDTPWGSFEFAELMPHWALKGMVRQIFYVRGDLDYKREKILPEGDVVMLINLGPTQRLVDAENPSRITDFCGAFVSGLQHEYVIVESRDESHMMGVRLWPLGGYRILGLPMSELADQVIEFDWVRAGLAHLPDQLAEQTNLAERFSLLEGYLLDWLERGPEPTGVVRAALSMLTDSGGLKRLGAVCNELEVSARHLNQRFTEQVGTNPKGYARLIQFNRALRGLATGPASLAQLAHDCGYYDQSHFNREFRRITGVSPGEYLQSAGPDGSSIVID